MGSSQWPYRYLYRRCVEWNLYICNPTPSLAAGEDITITIVVANNHFENLAGQNIAIAIDGSYTSGATTFNDLSDVNGNCTPESIFADAETQIISARSTITPVNPAAFVPQVTP
jgi:hypothetical protein